MTLQPGQIVDRFVVEEPIGTGGMAVVYRVHHHTLGTRHALKVLQSTHPEVRERLILEGQVQAKLRHPHVVSVTDVLDIDGHPGLLMDYIQGPALDHWLINHRPDAAEALTIFRGIVAGVGYAHEQGLVHRDLKSANVMLSVDADGGVVPQVADFGLAKVTTTDVRRTEAGTTFGTPAFMAPEQIRDASTVDRRADLYSLGCILYELFCGRTPHHSDDLLALFTSVAKGEYPDPRTLNPSIPEGAARCIEALLVVDANQRLPDCAAVIEVLEGGSPSLHFGRARPVSDSTVQRLRPELPGAVYAVRFVKRLHTPAIFSDLPTPTEARESIPTLVVAGLGSVGALGSAAAALLFGTVVMVVMSIALRTPSAPRPKTVPSLPVVTVPEPPPVPTPKEVVEAPALPDPPPVRPLPTAKPTPVPRAAPIAPRPAPVVVVAPTPLNAATVAISLNSSPWELPVSVDGVSLGVTPLKGVKLTVGSHTIRMVRDGDTLTKIIEVRDNGPSIWKWDTEDGSWTAK